MGDIPVFAFVRKYAYWLIPVLIVYMTLEPLTIEKYTAPFHKFYLYKVIGCLPLMLFGVLLKQHKEQLLKLPKWGLAMFFLVYVALVMLNGETEIWRYIFGANYALFYVRALTASILLFNLCKNLKTNKIVETFSKGTLLIMGLHSPIIEVCGKIFDVLGMSNPYLCWVSSIIVMLLCYYPIRLALKYCPVVLGK